MKHISDIYIDVIVLTWFLLVSIGTWSATFRFFLGFTDWYTFPFHVQKIGYRGEVNSIRGNIKVSSVLTKLPQMVT